MVVKKQYRLAKTRILYHNMYGVYSQSSHKLLWMVFSAKQVLLNTITEKVELGNAL